MCLACYGDRVAVLLETATRLRFYAEGETTPRRQLDLPGPAQLVGLAPLLVALRLEDGCVLLCGGMACCSQRALSMAGVRVESWIGGAADEVAAAWWNGSVERCRLPGCRRGWRRRCREKQTREARIMPVNIIAITSEGPELTDMVDPRFGRAGGFVVVDLATGSTKYVDNGGAQALAQGAGIQAAENVSAAGAQDVLSGFVGPKAFAALTAVGIAVVQDVENMTVGEAVEKYRRGEFAAASAPNAQAGGRH